MAQSPKGKAGSEKMGEPKTGGSGAPAADFTRMFAQMKMPSGMIDADAVMAMYRRNIEVLSAANRVALEGAQTVARRHMEMLQQTMTDMTATMKTMTSADAPQQKAANQADLLKHAYEKAVANAKELSDLIQKANADAISLLNNRVVEALGEVKSLMKPAKPGH
ncbi:MAG TPA: TIGR01841 family phasin [Acetobacteraceae bacterium]|nr:TIGR01841 family phasin [Acetobacteraceae bacterium]